MREAASAAFPEGLVDQPFTAGYPRSVAEPASAGFSIKGFSHCSPDRTAEAILREGR